MEQSDQEGEGKEKLCGERQYLPHVAFFSFLPDPIRSINSCTVAAGGPH
jgi:hypothetical protein